MNEQHHVFLYPRKAEIARTLYQIAHSEYEDCYTANIFRHIETVDTTYGVVLDAVREFEQQGWLERGYRDGRTKRIELTETGERVFSALSTFMEELEA